MATTFTVDTTPFLASGYIQLNWTNAGAGSPHYSYRVYRRVGTTGAWVLVYETFGTTPFVYKDWWAAAQTQYQYAVVQVTLPAGVQTEEAKVASALTAALTQYGYWLIHPTDETLNLNLGVAGDEYKEETDQQIYNLIGRGRKVDVGTSWGKSGSLDVKIRDKTGLSARSFRLKLDILRATQTYLHLKNPFGDVDKIALGDIGYSRVPGAGQSDIADASIPYFEVA